MDDFSNSVVESNKVAFSYVQATSLRNEQLWNEIGNITVAEAVGIWLGTLHDLTRRNYVCGFNKMAERGLLDPTISLQAFSLINHEAVIDSTKLVEAWSEATCQARAASYISFTGFLSRRTQGLIRKAIPSKEGSTKTFFRIREKVKTKAMTRAQWTAFFEELEKVSLRDCLIGKITLQGGKRINEVLSLDTDNIVWNERQIHFQQSKTRGLIQETIITYPQSLLDKLTGYIGDRTGPVFVTRTGKRVFCFQLNRSFAKAGRRANIPFKVTPHVLRASTVTYLKMSGFQDDEIMNVTGHASSEMIRAYDKRSKADNASARVSLVD